MTPANSGDPRPNDVKSGWRTFATLGRQDAGATVTGELSGQKFGPSISTSSMGSPSTNIRVGFVALRFSNVHGEYDVSTAASPSRIPKLFRTRMGFGSKIRPLPSVADKS